MCAPMRARTLVCACYPTKKQETYQPKQYVKTSIKLCVWNKKCRLSQFLSWMFNFICYQIIYESIHRGEIYNRAVLLKYMTMVL